MNETTLEGGGGIPETALEAASAPNPSVSFEAMERMAEAVTKSRLFAGVQSREQALTLMLICQAEGMHPMQALRLFDLIQSQGGVRVAMKSKAMLARFMERGGQVEWVEVTDEACEAIFHAPGLKKPVNVRWTMDEARKAGLASKANWKMYAADMLKWRCVSRGVDMADPAAALGLYPTDVAKDFGSGPMLITGPEVEDEDLTPKLEASIEQAKARKANAVATSQAAVAQSGPVRGSGNPARGSDMGISCVADGSPKHCSCGAEVGLYFDSTQPGRENDAYRMCKEAHETRVRLLDEGMPTRDVALAVHEHYRAWPAKKAAK